MLKISIFSFMIIIVFSIVALLGY